MEQIIKHQQQMIIMLRLDLRTANEQCNQLRKDFDTCRLVYRDIDINIEKLTVEDYKKMAESLEEIKVKFSFFKTNAQ